MRRTIFVASVLGNVATTAAAGYLVRRRGLRSIAARVGIARVELPERQDFRRGARQRFDGLPGARVVALGDSHVEFGSLHEVVPGLARRGIVGATIREAARWVDLVIYPETDSLVVWVGANDVLLGRTAEQAREDYRCLLAEIRRVAPGVRLVFVTVPPPVSHGAIAAAVNAELATLCAAEGVRLVDVVPLLAPGGELTAQCSLDGTHLTAQGYLRVGPVIVAALA